MSSFWGLIVHPTKSYTQTVDSPFRITMACLSEAPAEGRHSLTLTVEGESGNETYVLCNLTTDKTEQQQLDLIFEEGEQITLQMIGKSPIHLSGSYLPEEQLPDYDMDDDESIDSDDVGFLDDDDEDEDEEDDDEIPRIPSGTLKELTGDSEEDDEQESEEDEMEVEAPKPVKNQKQPVVADGKRKAETQTPQPDAKKAKTASAAASALKPAEKATPAAVPVKDAKKPADSAKATPAQKTPADKGTPATAPKGQDARGAKDSKQSTPSGASESGDKEPKKKTLPSGLSIEDKIVGSGAKAKNGKTLAVRYIGKLANGKVFDSNTSGNPFKIQLGKGSVIKGWEVGLQGMNAGGTRVLTIPPNLAYGPKGAPPDIPPNSTLTFEVKLLQVE